MYICTHTFIVFVKVPNIGSMLCNDCECLIHFKIGCEIACDFIIGSFSGDKNGIKVQICPHF